ncbi:glycosyl transferase family 1 [Thiohalorhabdus denitrificans]|uniref:Putative glycosyltransferase, TIGR04348 family n=1 Tax=Thiohalorhabdus denitrificans TaxID=381306 RepID=A0A0P9C3R9_9GAMM|nr:selenoneine biosynthesis selenosugar synthase SenB [Thiohalorhabdus denitrificans]KPV39623.1 glycosyl transferase family 1 [Thiohalorhabdus denitrificans]SCX96431.1 putative glycosyltransferase, TIGR04348 family [Thiohalorhabdus denitrificans]
MRIRMITPAARGSRSGNRATAERWARFLRAGGHRVDVATDYADEPADAMVALHAWRSAGAAARFRDRHPDRPLVVALTGTDLYRFQASDPDTTHRTMGLADRLVAIHEAAADDIPARFHDRLTVIIQSATPPPGPRQPVRGEFRALVVGHLRHEKDPFRPARAARRLPPDSRVVVHHFGLAPDAEWAEAARAEMANNPRYRWHGEMPRWRVRRALSRAHLLVHSSRMEGGANAVGEAIVAGVPVLASAIPGNTGLLGRDYPGRFPVEDTAALTDLLRRAEGDPDFYATLTKHCRQRAPLFEPEREAAAWRGLMNELTAS